MQDIDFLRQPAESSDNMIVSEKPSQSLHNGVGESSRILLTKKYLAVFFGCTNSRGVDYKRLYRHVLTAEVLEKAGIQECEIRKQSHKTFTALQSSALMRVLNL